MTAAHVLLIPDEDLRLRECAQELIHLPGAVQPHGALVTVDPRSFEILQASENSESVLGVTALALIGASISALVDGAAEAFLRGEMAAGTGSATTSIATQVNGRAFDVIAHLAGDVGVVEFEPALELSKGRAYVSALNAVTKLLSSAADIAELRNVTAHEVRELTGFDQVMIYQFHPDGHGEVVADDHVDGMTPYFGLHFPASDIPPQARRLYQLKRSGLIASSDYQPSVLVPVSNPRTGMATDLSRAELRSVSPHHLQFMRNMGQGASLTLSLVLDGRLVGLVTCAHHEPRRVPLLLRRICEILAQQVVLQLDAMTRTRRLTHQLQARDLRATLFDQMKVGLDVAAGLTEMPVTMLDLLPADGATVSLHHRITGIGETPTYAETSALLAALTNEDGTVSPLLTEALALDFPALAALVPTVAGALVLPFGGAGECLVWFRREITQTVDWLGAQTLDNRATPLSPRTSFEQWRQTVTDRCAPWDEMHIAEAAELARDIDQVLLRRAEAQMAYMALHDSLTGLPNRRLLVDRINSALERADRHGAEVAILFCDLDDFKRVNDTAGHAAGDAVLVEAATRLTAALRAGDTVARVGGDEFVVVLEPALDHDPAAPLSEGVLGDPASITDLSEPTDSRAAAEQIAERIKTDLTRPIDYAGHEHVVSVGVGITFAAPGSRAEDLLRDADAAMYRAKQTGKNRVATFDDSLRTSIFDRAAAEHALRFALTPAHLQHPQHPQHPQLSVLYEPAIDLDRGRLVGFAASPRLTDASGSPIPAELFAGVADHTSLFRVLGESVLDAALAALITWRTAHATATPVRMGIQLGARQAQQADLPTWIGTALARHGLQPPDLALELTESVLIEAGSSTLRQLHELRDSGVGIVINDFGSGYASLRQLAILPADAVKVDRTFTAGLPHDTTGATIVRAVAGIAADLGLACVFTGIDTEEQATALPPGVITQGALYGLPTLVPAFQNRRRDGSGTTPSTAEG